MNEDDLSCRIAADFNDLGVVEGDTVLVHSAFKSLGPVPGGIETVVQGLLLAVGPEGTLLMPALSRALRPPEVFDERSTPANVGAIPEYSRTREGTTRSLHPTHSVCAVGRVADLDAGPFLRRGQVLQAATIVLDAPQLKSAVLRKLEQAPLFFVQAQATQ